MAQLNVDRLNGSYEVTGGDLESLLYQATLTYEQKVEALRQTTKNVMDRCERNLRALDEKGKSDNSLGVLQGAGMELDRLCGEVEVAKNSMESVQYLVESVS